mmetsp:Transcript_1937/g.5393  ORF Transcript_1937/g.5393 Transcript_1937/m.5393 type:complete len:285 (+) Transcript_1937:752-1606(+)
MCLTRATRTSTGSRSRASFSSRRATSGLRCPSPSSSAHPPVRPSADSARPMTSAPPPPSARRSTHRSAATALASTPTLVGAAAGLRGRACSWGQCWAATSSCMASSRPASGLSSAAPSSPLPLSEVLLPAGIDPTAGHRPSRPDAAKQVDRGAVGARQLLADTDDGGGGFRPLGRSRQKLCRSDWVDSRCGHFIRADLCRQFFDPLLPRRPLRKKREGGRFGWVLLHVQRRRPVIWHARLRLPLHVRRRRFWRRCWPRRLTRAGRLLRSGHSLESPRSVDHCQD